jgi:glycosyltransferase involved in cell wall biosynthesis
MLTKRFRGTRHFIWEMDLFPEALTDFGHLAPSSLATRAIGAIADYVRLRSDGIIALGECMRDRLLARGLPPDLIHVAENWADGDLITATPSRVAGSLRVVYSGNLGLAHDTETIAQAMLICKNDSRLHFTFAGGGARRKDLESVCTQHGVSNVKFLSDCDREAFGEWLASSDIGLVTQRSCCVGTVVPSKVYGLLAAGKPLLFIGPREATPARIIERFGCGWHIECGDVANLVALLRHLQQDPARLRIPGERAREAFLAHYDLPHGVSRICDILGLKPVAHEVPAVQ